MNKTHKQSKSFDNSRKKEPFNLLSSEYSSVLVAVGFGPLVFVVLLMIVFCFPKSRGRFEHRGHPISLFGQQADVLLSDRLFCLIVVEDAGEVLRTDVGTLTVCLCKVVCLEKELHHRLVGGLVGIENHFGGLQVAGVLLAHLGVS